MKERPILFSGPMVRAILDGRKTQTRRIMKMKSNFYDIQTANAIHPDGSGQGWIAWWSSVAPTAEETAKMYPGHEGFCCPLGKPGDRLWVRESFWQAGCWVRPDALRDEGDAATVWQWSKDGVFYCADMPDNPDFGFRKRPSIHMPRWASRLTLENSRVSVDRLQDISEEDAVAEGLSCITKDGSLYKYGIADRDGFPGNDNYGWHWKEWENNPRFAYKKLWELINGPGSWDANPWVWVIEFKRVTNAS